MASTAPAPALQSNGGTNASIWAKESGPTRTGWGRNTDSAAAPRGAGRGAPRGRSSRGGRGGRSASGRGGPPVNPADTTVKRSSPDQAKEKAPSNLPKPTAPPPPIALSTSTQSGTSSKPSNRPKPPRKLSEHKAGRKTPSIAVDPVAAPANNTASPQTSPRTPRRKRSHTQSKTPTVTAPPQVLSVPRKQSLSAQSSLGRAGEEKPATVIVKDIPPHLAPAQSDPSSFDIAHNIDALVEHVRAVAMDRPHTPGSHFDWAGEEDDSLPDLDDWGVPSSAAELNRDSEKAHVISPILEDTLKPLPLIIDIDIPTPSIRLHEINGDNDESQAILDADNSGEETPRRDGEDGTPFPPRKQMKEGLHHAETNGYVNKANSTTDVKDLSKNTSPLSTSSKMLSHPSLPAKPTFGVSAKGHPQNGSSQPTVASVPTKPSVLELGPTTLRPQSADIPATRSSLSPGRGLSASMHAVLSSTSTPNGLNTHSHSFPHTPLDGFNPTHNRAHTVGRYRPDNLSDSDRPRRGDMAGHGRNHSTPPTGPGIHRASHAVRPVITVDAISKLARSLGGTPLAKRERGSAASPAAKES
ncbi:hypothetical protein EW026_g438 [Hermanssonia centrifuga]|uniref:Uncharacterized protein n=1 Tax=Hermanssonia centrifuga TaxID=98765 RepID=A0A4S4KUQ9_9APHY|nr:hypothetical protein EW026_g438 [Hermanssonia centrifuga]